MCPPRATGNLYILYKKMDAILGKEWRIRKRSGRPLSLEVLFVGGPDQAISWSGFPGTRSYLAARSRCKTAVALLIS